MPQQKIFTKEVLQKLRDNAKAQNDCGGRDFKPVVKVFNPYGPATWLFTELGEDGRLFGLCDLGMQCPEVGYASLEEVEGIRIMGKLKLERDAHFTADKMLSEYVEEAREKGRIVA